VILIYDTETSDLPLWKEPSKDPRQPHICQIAAILCEEDGTKRASIDLTTRRPGWTCSEEALGVHGITDEVAERIGLHEDAVLATFILLVEKADHLVAFGERFDQRIIRIALKRFGEAARLPSEDWWKDRSRTCLLWKMNSIMRTGKTPKLEEAMAYLFPGEPMVAAHSAMGDCMAARRLYLELRRRGVL
jgi:DNA polymerase-3 subunit epsilon